MPGVAPFSFRPFGGGPVTESLLVLIGGVLVLLFVLGLVVLLLRDFVRITVKIVALVVILGGVAMWFGWLDSSLARDFLSAVGEWAMAAYNSLADRFAEPPAAP